MRLYGVLIWLLIAAFVAALPIAAQDKSINVTDCYVYPDNNHSFNKLAGYVWPEVTALNLLVAADTSGYNGESKVELFYAIFDEQDKLISKDRQKHFLPAGSHDLVVPEFLNTADVFGKRVLKVEIEVALKGAEPINKVIKVNLTGPDPPLVEFSDLYIYNAQGGYRDRNFQVGSEFIIEAVYDVEENFSNAEPTVEIFCMMEEDAFQLSPGNDYQPFEQHRGMKRVEGGNGRYLLRAAGFLPHLFAEPYNYVHEFRIYVSVDFGAGARTTEYIYDSLYDAYTGDHRYSEELEDRLIEINPPYSWDVRRVAWDYRREHNRRSNW